ncbi:hypothetical protein L596_010399 [Steinernema carpocapsae]|uniref:Sphingomyelin phosphodiesterase n=1 Tax=Steinernema carpocapsae TaxID=34508 RepID=A0A4U5PIA6_STECR|nr:hypothetical protein L596_010399 [Steinernema carpocapsae]
MRLWVIAPLVIVLLHGTSGDPIRIKNEDKDLTKVQLGGPICSTCHTFVKAFQFVYGRKFTQNQLINLLVFICRTFSHTDSSVCRAMGGQFREELLYVIRELIFKPDQLCGLITNNCGESYNPFRANWTITLPAEIPDSRPASPYPTDTQKVLRVLQLSDLHFDLSYIPGSEADCGLPICCQLNASATKRPAGYWGTVGACDLPPWTIENMFQHLNATSDDFDYILLSGDYMSHNDWTYTREEHQAVIQRLENLFKTYLPKKPVFWAVGNHEGVPVNSFAPHFAPEKFQPAWLYESVSKAERMWINKEAQEDMEYRGSYVIQAAEKLKVVSLNTGYCETTNFWLYINETDPDGAMTWFVKQLFKAETDGHFVHVMAHIPPGDSECLEGWAFNYYRVMNRFKNIITAQFFGHVHTDSFTVFYEDMNDPKSKPTGVLYQAPSVTTYENLNPGYRIYKIEGDFEGSQYRVLDFNNYFLNLSKTQDSDKPQWEQLYSARSEYNLTDLSPKSWNNFISEISNDSEVYSRFLKNYARNDRFVCDKKCRDELLCSLRRGHHSVALCPHVTSLKDLESKIGKHEIYSQPVPSTENGENDATSFLDEIKSNAISKIMSLFSSA